MYCWSIQYHTAHFDCNGRDTMKVIPCNPSTFTHQHGIYFAIDPESCKVWSELHISTMRMTHRVMPVGLHQMQHALLPFHVQINY